MTKDKQHFLNLILSWYDEKYELMMYSKDILIR